MKVSSKDIVLLINLAKNKLTTLRGKLYKMEVDILVEKNNILKNEFLINKKIQNLEIRQHELFKECVQYSNMDNYDNMIESLKENHKNEIEELSKNTDQSNDNIKRLEQDIIEMHQNIIKKDKYIKKMEKIKKDILNENAKKQDKIEEIEGEMLTLISTLNKK